MTRDNGVIKVSVGSGIRLVTESMSDVSSASVGVWVGTGSRDETLEQSGISHFLEHLLFKGTEQLTAKDIAEAVDAVGGDMNAYTTKEYTTFYVRTLSEHLDLGLDILCDILRDPALRPDEVDAERQVILEEVLMHRDEPADVVQERFSEVIFPDHPLGREVLGLPEVIEGVTVGEIRGFFDHHYLPGNMVVAAAGDVEHDAVAEAIERRFVGRLGGSAPVRTPPPLDPLGLQVERRQSEQAHLVFGLRAPERRSPERYNLAVLNHALGGGLSSRLFQEVREARGLAYSIGSDRVAYEDTGAMAVSVGTAPENVAEVLGLGAVRARRPAGQGDHRARAPGGKGASACGSAPVARGLRLADGPDRRRPAPPRRGAQHRGAPRADRFGHRRRRGRHCVERVRGSAVPRRRRPVRGERFRGLTLRPAVWFGKPASGYPTDGGRCRPKREC